MTDTCPSLTCLVIWLNSPYNNCSHTSCVHLELIRIGAAECKILFLAEVVEKCLQRFFDESPLLNGEMHFYNHSSCESGGSEGKGL